MDKFKESVSKTYITVKDKWVSIPGKTRWIILAVAAVVVVSAIILTAVLNRSEMVPLVQAADRDEAISIRAAIASAGITEMHVDRNHMISVNARDSGLALIAISEAGLPRPGVNNDVWVRGVDMFSTDAVIKETNRQQLQAWIVTYLNNIPQVDHSQAIVQMPVSRNFVMVQNRDEASAALRVTLRPGEFLTNEQIKGIHMFVQNSVPGLEARNISLTDGNGIPLIAGEEDGVGPWTELALMQARYSMEIAIRAQMEETARRTLRDVLHRVFGENDYAYGLTVEMDFDPRDIEIETFTPVVGEDRGIVRNIIEQVAAGGNAAVGGPIGTWGNAEVAPNYPTIPDVSAGEEFFLEQVREINYEINRMVETYRTEGLYIKSVSASVFVNREPMTDAEVENWEAAIATLIGTTAENVNFITFPFTPVPVPPPPHSDGGSLTRTILIWIIVSLGLLLVILFALAITTSSSRKKRLVRARGFVPATDVSGYLRDDSFAPVADEPEGWDLPSLLDENETKDVVLKREIREFTRSHPEIIAQLIRTWLREEE
jgi:flagellar M-ring protein FliF